MILFVLTPITLLCQRLTQSRKSRFPAVSHAAFQYRHRYNRYGQLDLKQSINQPTVTVVLVSHLRRSPVSHAAFQCRHRGIGVVIKFDAAP